MKNNISFPNKTSYIGGDYASGEYNTWNLNITPAASDFLSVDDPSMTITGQDLSTIAGMLGPRQPDGSLPDLDFLKLKKGSQMIDKGVNIGIPYVGGAPDLGAYEYGMSSAASSSSAQSSSSAASSSSSVTATSSSAIEPESSSSSVGFSSSVILSEVEGSSSSDATTALFNSPAAVATNSPMQVFDAQGRALGTIKLNGNDIESALRQKFHRNGIYLVRSGATTTKVILK